MSTRFTELLGCRVPIQQAERALHRDRVRLEEQRAEEREEPLVQVARLAPVVLQGRVRQHVNVFLKNAADFEDMNRAYRESFGSHLPARTAITVSDLPKQGALLTMNLTAVTKD